MIGHSGLISNTGDKDFFFTVSRPNMDPIQPLGMCNGGLFQSSGALQLTPIPWNVEVQKASRNNCTSSQVFAEWCSTRGNNSRFTAYLTSISYLYKLYVRCTEQDTFSLRHLFLQVHLQNDTLKWHSALFCWLSNSKSTCP